jgi:uncharacterized DUF497 family protein
MTIFHWDTAKAVLNWKKHGISFDTAQLVFDDPYAFTEHDRIEGGERRWQTIGLAGGTAILLVAHTFREGDVEIIRIISARRATRQERLRYEQNRQENAW